MKRMRILCSLVLALTIASTTCALAAGNPVLPGSPIQPIIDTTHQPIQTIKGEWQTIGTRSCAQAVLGGEFGPGPQFQILSDGSSRVTQETGVLSLFGDGTGSWIGKSVQIDHVNGAYAYPVSGYTTECDIAYQEVSDRVVNFQFDNCISTFTAGYLTGSIGGNSHFTAHHARLSADGMTMVIWDLDPRNENTWITTGGVTTNYNRVCARTGTAIKFQVPPLSSDKGNK